MKIVKFNNLTKKEKEIFYYLDKIIVNSYNPYSKFYVASAVLTTNNKIFYGVNIETCVYTSICAKRTAIGKEVTSGYYKFNKIFILAKSDYFKVKILSGPCGICRQIIYEFSELIKRDIQILIADSELKKF
jgi:cytidine deaminase